jgi:hypothetical protein
MEADSKEDFEILEFLKTNEYLEVNSIQEYNSIKNRTEANSKFIHSKLSRIVLDRQPVFFKAKDDLINTQYLFITIGAFSVHDNIFKKYIYKSEFPYNSINQFEPQGKLLKSEMSIDFDYETLTNVLAKIRKELSKILIQDFDLYLKNSNDRFNIERKSLKSLYKSNATGNQGIIGLSKISDLNQNDKSTEYLSKTRTSYLKYKGSIKVFPISIGIVN